MVTRPHTGRIPHTLTLMEHEHAGAHLGGPSGERHGRANCLAFHVASNDTDGHTQIRAIILTVCWPLG